MILVNTNIGEVVKLLVAKLDNLADTDKALRTSATSVLALMKVRIHQKGQAADGSQIGTYSKGYMVIRTGGFQNAKRVTRGDNKGKLKDAGVFTDRTIRLNKQNGVFTGEDKVGKARPKYNRTADPKVIISLTRQTENDEQVFPLGQNSYGIGFSNPLNFKKSQWVEQTYRKSIYALSEEEKNKILEVFESFVQDTLNK